MGTWNNPVVLPPPQASYFQRQTLPLMTSFLTNLALAKIQRNWKRQDLEAGMKLKEHYIKASKPDKVPEGMFSYFDGNNWKVTNKPVSEEKKQAAATKREKAKLFQQAIIKGSLVPVPAQEYETLPSAMRQQQIIMYEGKPYARATQRKEPPAVAKIKGQVLYDWLSDKPLGRKKKQLLTGILNTPESRLDFAKKRVQAILGGQIEAFRKHTGREPTQSEMIVLLTKNPFIAMMSGTGQPDQEQVNGKTNNPGIPQNIIDFYVSQYGLTPEQVIEAYKKKQAGQ